jgi:hypothetical protein
MVEQVYKYSMKEREPGRNFDFGIAISNLANAYNSSFPIPEKLPELIYYLGKEGMGAELQLEPPHGSYLPRINTRNLPFFGVHLPINREDTKKERTVGDSLDAAARTLEMASQFDANYLVVHLEVDYDWDNLGVRSEAVKKGLDIFYGITEKAKEEGFNGDLIIENLEFPLYPALSSEIIEVGQILNSFEKRQFGLALDLGHLLHTQILINDNKQKGDAILPFTDPFVGGEIGFDNYLNNLMVNVGTKLKLLHVTGVKNHETHLMPTVVPGENDRNELNLMDDLHIISGKIKSRRLPLVNEAHDRSYTEMVNACKLIQFSL